MITTVPCTRVNDTHRTTGRRRWHFGLAITLFALLSGVYCLTYNGVPVSNDEQYLFDSAQSLVRRGNLRHTVLFDLQPYIDDDGTPGTQSLAEPLQVILAALLLWVAQWLPGIGLMHTVWFLNVFVTALTAVVLFGVGLWLGYRPVVAWLGALLFGVATIAWPYSRLLFREPLTALFTLASFVAAWAIRKEWPRPTRRTVLLLALSFLGAFLSKVITLLLLPGLLIAGLPLLNIAFRNRKFLAVVLIVCVALVLLILVLSTLGIGRYKFSFEVRPDTWPYVIESVLGYQISPGRSLWLYSPVLLLAVGGALRMVRHNMWPLVIGPTLSVLIFTMSYGLTNSTNWWGGIGWGPRYLVPLVPVLMLWIFPALDWLLSAGRGILWRLGALALIIGSVAIQSLSLAVNLRDYYQYMWDSGVVAWQEGIWTWQWSPIAQYLGRLDLGALDIAWSRRANPGWLPATLAITLATLGAAGGLWLLRYSDRQRASLAGMAGLCAAMLGATLGTGLYSLRSDPRYTNKRDDVMQLLTELDAVAKPSDAIFLENKDYQVTFMNYFKTPALLMTLPFAPGERHGPDEIPRVVSENPADLLGPGSTYAMDWAAKRYERLWLVTGYGPFLPYALRPAERYLVDHYFPVTEISTSPLARAIRFAPVNAPSGKPSIEVGYRFGHQLALVGFDLPLGHTFRPGDVVPVSLVWQALANMSFDYNVSVQVTDARGLLLAQRDGTPQSTFGYTSHWLVGQTFRDNHGLQLPRALEPGTYDLQVIVYTWQTGQRLEVSSGDGRQLGETAKLIPIVIQ